MLYTQIGFVAALAPGAAAIAIKTDQCMDDDQGFVDAFEELGAGNDDDDNPFTGCDYPAGLLAGGLPECTLEAFEELTGQPITDEFERQVTDLIFCNSRQYCPVTCAGASGAPANALDLYCAEDCSAGNDDGDQCVDDPLGYITAVLELAEEYEDRIPNDDDDDDDDDAGDDDDGANPCTSLLNSFDAPVTECTLEAVEAVDGPVTDAVEREFAEKTMCLQRQYCPVTCAGLSGAPSNGLEQYCAEDCSGAANMQIGMVPVMVVGLAALKNLLGA
jgi:hypothetical protein